MPVNDRMTVRIVILITVLVCCSVTFSEDFSNWQYFMTVQINTSASGVGISDTIYDFPLLIRLNPKNFPFFSQIRPGGADVRFSKSDGTDLSYQIEHWVDNSDDNDSAAIWVLMDTIYGDNSSQNITMFWGRAGATDSSDAGTVFQNDRGFIAVYHLDSTLTNATGNGYNAVDQGEVPTMNVNSIIGTGCFFGGNSFIAPGDLQDRGVGTMSFWFRPAETFDSSSAVTQGIWGKTDGNATNANISLRGVDYDSGGNGSIGQIQAKVETDNKGFYCNSTTDSFTGGSWYHLAICWDGTSTKLFIDGVLEKTEMSSETVTGESNDEIGRAWYDVLNISDETPRYFIGTLDEFRFEFNVHSDGWIRLCYQNQKIDQKLITFDLEGEPPVITSEPEKVVAVVGKAVSFGVTAEGDGEISFKWLCYPSDSIGNEAELAISSVALADTGSAFRCVVESEFGIDSSGWITLTVIDTPRILLQPMDQNIDSGGRAVFTLEVKDTTKVSYSWRKVGSSEELSTARLYIIDEVNMSDSGSYYCLIDNPAAGISSDTVSCTISGADSGGLKARFSISPNTGHVPLAVSFTDASKGEITSYHWDFGDRTHDTVMNPTHVYNETGNFTVTLIVKGPDGSDTLIKSDSVTVYDSTLSAENSIVIDTAYYDPYSGTIRVFWHIDPEVAGKSPQVGISYSFSPYDLMPVGSDTLTPTSENDDATVNTVEALLYDTTYYIALWFRLPGGEWIEPTIRSMVSVRTDACKYESISYFDPDVTRDTVAAFDGRVRIWKDGDYTKDEYVTDTLEQLQTSSLPEGLVPVGPSIRFRCVDSTSPFFLGIRVNSIPAGYSMDNVHIYRCYDGVCHVMYDTKIDTVNGFAYIKTGELIGAFLPMVDTIPPDISVLVSTLQPITDSVIRHLDSVKITDNIDNVQWRYFYGSDNDFSEPASEGTTSVASSGFSVQINDTLPETDLLEGFRIVIVAYDGCGSDTLQFIRPVRFNRSDSLTTVPNVWNPVYAKTVLDHPEVDSLIARLKSINEIRKYNTRFFRLFRWCDYKGNEHTLDKWVEYRSNDKKIKSLFTLDPGKMVWLKTYTTITVSLGEGDLLSLEDTFSIELPPQQWTDFGMPYQFDVRIEEIFSATGENSDSVMVFKWNQEAPGASYFLEPLYVQGMPDRQDRMMTIEHQSKGGYSFYNTGKEPVTLRIPPVPSYMKKEKCRTMSEDDSSGMWSIKCILREKDGTNRTAVYFGYAPGKSEEHFPPAPTFSKIRTAVVDRKSGKLYGHYISDDAREGLVKELRIINDGDEPEELTYNLEKTGVFPESFSAYCYDEKSGELTDKGTVTVASGGSASRWIVVGDASYRKQFIDKTADRSFQLHSLYPNPCRSAVMIRYSVPFGAREQISIAVFTTTGKKVWEKNVGSCLSDGEHVVSWSGINRTGFPVGSGLYIVQLTIADADGTVIRMYNRQVTFLR